MEHAIVDIGSDLWFMGWGFLSVLMLLALRGMPELSPSAQRRVEISWGILLLVSLIVENLTMISSGSWSLEWSLPLHMCSMSGLLAIYTMFTGNRMAYLFLLYWGVSGGFHSLLTPEMTLGDSPVMSVVYYFWHTSIIVVPVYFFKVRGYGLERRSFWKVLGRTHIVWLFIALLDWAIGANYMYVLEPPVADNPFVINEFPYHLIGFEFAGILHFAVIALIFSTIWRKQLTRSSARINNATA